MKLSGPSPNLDLLRSVAVLLVVLDHLTATLGIAQRHPSLFAAGRFGVLLFFIHTSCVLMMSLERLGVAGWRLFGTFYMRRIFRIYPLSTVVIALVLLARIPSSSWTPSFHMPDAASIVFNFLLCGNLAITKPVLGPLWSLPYEVEMYLVLPAIFLWFRRRDYSYRRLALFWVGAVVLGLLQLWGSRVGRFGIGRLDLAEFSPCFVTGVIAYFLAARVPRSLLPEWVWPLIVGAVSLAYSTFAPLGIWSMYGDRGLGWLACVIVGFFLPFCAEQSNKIVQVASHYIAKYSYGLYLGQVPVMWFAFVRLNHLPIEVRWIVFAILIVSVPVLSFHVIEAPLMKIGTNATRALSTAAHSSLHLGKDPITGDPRGIVAAASRLAS